MKRIWLLIPFFLAVSFGHSQIKPSEDYPNLFDSVQRSKIFADSKTFPDSKPLKDIQQIGKLYQTRKSNPHFNTTTKVISPDIQGNKSITEHIRTLCPVLTRHDSSSADSLTSRINLPHPYVVPGGRFNEMYYWDSYFTLLDLEESGKTQLSAEFREEPERLTKSLEKEYAFGMKGYKQCEKEDPAK